MIYESHVRGDLIIETLDAPPPSTPIAAPPTTRHRGRVVLAPSPPGPGNSDDDDSSVVLMCRWANAIWICRHCKRYELVRVLDAPAVVD